MTNVGSLIAPERILSDVRSVITDPLKRALRFCVQLGEGTLVEGEAKEPDTLSNVWFPTMQIKEDASKACLASGKSINAAFVTKSSQNPPTETCVRLRRIQWLLSRCLC